jgi:hypothetical protein
LADRLASRSPKATAAGFFWIGARKSSHAFIKSGIVGVLVTRILFIFPPKSFFAHFRITAFVACFFNASASTLFTDFHLMHIVCSVNTVEMTAPIHKVVPCPIAS